MDNLHRDIIDLVYRYLHESLINKVNTELRLKTRGILQKIHSRHIVGINHYRYVERCHTSESVYKQCRECGQWRLILKQRPPVNWSNYCCWECGLCFNNKREK